MKFALNYLDIEPEHYALTMQKVMQEPNIKELCEQNDMDLRGRLDHKELTQSKEELKKIWMQVVEGEAEVLKSSTGGPESQHVMLFEKTKLYDKIYQDHDIKIHQLNVAVKEHKIDEDPDVIELQDSLKMQELDLRAKLEKENSVGAERQKLIKEDVEKLPACPELGHPAVLNFEYWLQLFKILNLHVNAESLETREKHKVARRNVLKSGSDQDYQQCIAGQA